MFSARRMFTARSITLMAAAERIKPSRDPPGSRGLIRNPMAASSREERHRIFHIWGRERKTDTSINFKYRDVASRVNDMLRTRLAAVLMLSTAHGS